MKKLVLGLILLTTGVGLAGPRNVYYGGQVAYNAIRDFVGARIPDQLKLESAKSRLADENMKLEDSNRLLAKLEVQSENQGRKIAKLEAKMEREQRRLASLRSQLPGGKSKFVSVSSGSQEEIAKNLAEGLQSYATDSELLASEREQARELANQVATLQTAIGERRAKLVTLERLITSLESRLKTIRLRNGGIDLPSEDGAKEIERLLESLDENVSVEERLYEMHRSSMESPISHRETEVSAADAISQFDAMFPDQKNSKCSE